MPEPTDPIDLIGPVDEAIGRKPSGPALIAKARRYADGDGLFSRQDIGELADFAGSLIGLAVNAEPGTSILPGVHAQAVVDAGLAEFVAGNPNLDFHQLVRWTYLDDPRPEDEAGPYLARVRRSGGGQVILDLDPPNQAYPTTGSHVLVTTWPGPGASPTVPAPLYTLTDRELEAIGRATDDNGPLGRAARAVVAELHWWHNIAADREAQRITRVLFERLADAAVDALLVDGTPDLDLDDWVSGLTVFQQAAINRVLGPDSPFAPLFDGPGSMPIEMPRSWAFHVEFQGGPQPTDYGTGTEWDGYWFWSITDQPDAGEAVDIEAAVLAGMAAEDPSELLSEVVAAHNRAGLAPALPPGVAQLAQDLANSGLPIAQLTDLMSGPPAGGQPVAIDPSGRYNAFPLPGSGEFILPSGRFDQVDPGAGPLPPLPDSAYPPDAKPLPIEEGRIRGVSVDPEPSPTGGRIVRTGNLCRFHGGQDWNRTEGLVEGCPGCAATAHQFADDVASVDEVRASQARVLAAVECGTCGHPRSDHLLDNPRQLCGRCMCAGWAAPSET